MKRNWKKIEEIACRPTQIALATCSDKATLARLRTAFSECFDIGEETAVPWSLVERQSRDYIAREYDDHEGKGRYTELYYANRKHFPFCLKFGRIPGDDLFDDGPIPDEVLSQLLQIPNDHGFIHPTEPIFIRYEDKDWLVANIQNDAYCELPNAKDGLVFLVPKETVLYNL